MAEPFGQQMFARGILALTLAAKGFRVFPMRVNGKRPAITGWPERATTDPAQIGYGGRDGLQHRDLLRTAEGGGRAGAAADRVRLRLQGRQGRRSDAEGACRDGIAGHHGGENAERNALLLFCESPRAELGLAGGASRRCARAPRLRGGAGIEVDGKEYVLLDKRMPVLTPEVLLELAVRPSDSKADNVTYLNDAGAVGEIDSARAIERAKDWLINSAPEAIEGNRAAIRRP